MKVLIVDDEPIEREGMQAILQKAFPEIMICQAKNGKLAIELANTIQPNLVLMDIMMPGMTGLEAIEKIQAKNEAIKFVMVTAFDMFDYARQAIKLGVKDYLLKPSKASEIVATVGKVLEECRHEIEARMTSERQQEEWKKARTLAETDIVTQLLFDHVHELHIDMLVEMLDIHSSDEKFVMLVNLPEGTEPYYTSIKEMVHKVSKAWVGALYVRQLPIIVFRDSSKSFRSQAHTLAKAILSIDREKSGSDWFIGIGEVYEGLDKIRQSYQESLIASIDTTLAVKTRFYADVPAMHVATANHVIHHQQKDYFEKIRIGEWGAIHTDVLKVIQQYESEGASLIYTQQRVLKLLWIVNRVMNELGIEADAPFFPFQAQDYRQLREETIQLLKKMKKIYESHYHQMEADKIHQIKQYIRDHSHEDISLEVLAQRVQLSPIYISKMFKEKLGFNYIDFLTECRIEKAKKLLHDPERSLKEISYEIGYNDPNYFSRVFKKMCGLSPKAYRKTLLSNKSKSL